MLPPFVVPFVAGVVAAPLAGQLVKPFLRVAVKSTVEVAVQAKRLAAEAVEDLQDLAAEAGAEWTAGANAPLGDLWARSEPTPAGATEGEHRTGT